MGTSDDDDGVVVFDDMSTHHDGTLGIDRLLLEGYAYRTVSWGVRPVANHNTGRVETEVSSFGDDTLFVTWVPNFVYPRDSEGRRMSESLAASPDGTYQASVYLKPMYKGGVYHSILPQRYVPIEVSGPPATRLISARKSITGRLALTWLFTDALEVHMRIGLAREKHFDRLRAESIMDLKVHQHNEQPLGGAILRGFSELPSNPDAWRALYAAIEAASHFKR